MAKKDSKTEKAQAQEKDEGSATKEQAATPQDENAPIKKKKKILLIAGIGSIALAAIGTGGVFIMKTLGGKKEELAAQKLEESANDNESDQSKENEEKNKHESKNEKDDGAKEEKQQEHSSTEEKKKEQSENKEKEGKAGDQSKPNGSEGKDQSAAANGSTTANEGTAGGKESSASDSEENSFGETFNLPRMELNLGNPLENRFLKIAISLEYHGGEEQEKALEKRLPQIRDLVITLISQKTRMELLTPIGKETFRKQLKNTFNEVLEKPITNVYFTEFLVE